MQSTRPYRSLGNGSYCVVVTEAGDGFSTFGDVLLTGWRPDSVEACGGLGVYARDLDSGEYWTVCGGPVAGQSSGTVEATPDVLVIRREHGGIASRTVVRLHPELGLEERTCILVNETARPRRVDLTSFVEVTLNDHAAHESHPAFSKLFIQTTASGDGSVLWATRRARGEQETWPVLLHALLDAPAQDFTTDRVRFVGRGRGTADPLAMEPGASLGRTCGNVLDPAMSLRTQLKLVPNTTCSVRFILGASRDPAALRRAIDELRHAALGAGTVRPRDQTQLALVQSLTRGLSATDAQAARPSRRPLVSRASTEPPAGPAEALQFDNGLGGFTADGREYVMRIVADANQRPVLPPMPWTNVIANPRFGCLVSETGAGATWSGNSREYRLTPWSNDPVSDPQGDALYIRDAESGEFWCPTPGPAPMPADAEVRHGLGYSTWRLHREDLEHELTVFVPRDETLRVKRLQIRNRGARRRRLEIFAYNRWVLGGTAEDTRPHLAAEFSDSLSAVLARNASVPEGLAGIAFAAADRSALDGWCTDRAAFLGLPGSNAAPRALLAGGRLAPGRGADPCAVLQVALDIAPGASEDLSFLLGTAPSESDVGEVLARFRRPGHVAAALQAVRESWSGILSRLQIDTPSPALNVMVNAWLPYQDLACRLWGRTAFYQSGGAFGFRDQLQDAAALVYLRPDLARAQILLHASRQFAEGDVQHWWHPPLGRGLRTRFADDLLWLPWITAYYVAVTGDQGVLAERTGYLGARPLREGEAEAYLLPEATGEGGDVYEHCCRAIERASTRGAHGLPLFGCGDWNDGMNRVGAGGRGESVWMGFFLYTVLGDFLPLCELRGDASRAARYAAQREQLRAALETAGWDGRWYRRGWYDDGTVLGSHVSDECRIDALVQAWAVLSRAAPPDRAGTALDSLEQHLVDDRARLIRLLTPPFEHTPHDPGYIKGYLAGVRENGGQYTHAAAWVVRAMAEAGRRNRAVELLEGLLPMNHSLKPADVERYKVEPYVVAADVYGAEPHVGRGGWTWYTGSAGWMYRVAVESILGFGIEGGTTLCLRPRLPDAWPIARLKYRADDGTMLHIELRNPSQCAARVVGAQFDGAELVVSDDAVRVAIPRTGGTHQLTVMLGE